MPPSGHKVIARRRLLSVPCVVETLLLIGLLVLLSQALRPDFGGGRFILVTLLLAIILLGIALTRDVVGAVMADRDATRQPDGARAMRREWGVALRGLLLVVSLFSLMIVFGTLVAMTVIAAVMLRWYIGVRYVAAFAGAILLGVIIPVAFAWAVGITLWPGLIPELIPDWLGGGLLPPL